jgi:hypothetical protein
VLQFLNAIYGGGSRPQLVGVQEGSRLLPGLGGCVSVHTLTLSEEVVGYRSFAEGLEERSTISFSTRGIFGNFTSILLKGQTTGTAAPGFLSRDSKDPRSFAGGVCSRKDMGHMGESFDFRPLKEMLERLKIEVTCCIEWVDSGLDPVGLGPRPLLEKVALAEPKPSPIVNSLSRTC